MPQTADDRLVIYVHIQHLSSSHRQTISQSVACRAAFEQLACQADGHFSGVGAVVVIAQGKLLELLDEHFLCPGYRF